MGDVKAGTQALFALVLASCLGVGACTEGNISDTPSAAPSESPLPTLGPIEGPGSGKNANARGPVVVPKDAASGGEVTVLTAREPNTLDPTRAYYGDSTEILNLVTRALTQYAFDPESQSMVLVPDMATDLGRPNDDNTEWTFTLKEGLKYEDGSPVTADDVAYAISRSFAIDELPDGPTYQLQFFLDGDTYQGPYQDNSPYPGVEVDGNDITIKMNRPFPDMDYYASYPVFTGIPESKDTRDRYGDHPLATGPYMFEDYQPGRSLTLVRNPHWDPATDPGRIQSVDAWHFEFNQDPLAIDAAVLSKTGDGPTSLSLDNITRATWQGIRQRSIGQQRLVVGTAPCTYLWYLDMRKITDIRVRKAIGYAYPYVDAWRAGGDIVGLTRVPGTSILPPGTAGRVDYDVLGIAGQDTDPAMSRKLLREAGARGFEIKYVYASGDPASEAVNRVVVQALEAGGFTVTPIAPDSKIRESRSDQKSPVNVRSSGWCSDWPTGGSWFPAQWDGSLAGKEGMPNPANFDEADADQLQRDILSGKKGDSWVAWGEFGKYLEETYYPAVNLGYAGIAVLRGSRIGGMFIDDVRGLPTLQTVYVAR